MSVVLKRPIPLHPALQDYGWGMRDTGCHVATLTARARASRNPTPTRFAEAWFGQHPKGCSNVTLGSAELPLNELFRRHPELLGTTGTLPFQAKVLSVEQELSIQLHPPENRARILHSTRPGSYPDPFAKVEAGLALTKTELLYGFRDDPLRGVPELAALVPAKQIGPDAEGMLIQLIRGLKQLKQEQVRSVCKAIYRRLRALRGELTPNEAWVLKMEERYPEGDPGIFYFFLLNLVRLEPGQAIEIPTGRIHAYLSPCQIAEIMAPGDCVVRLGLTPKECDLQEVEQSAEFRPTQSATAIRNGEATGSAQRSWFPMLQLGIDRYTGPAAAALEQIDGVRFAVSLSAHGAFHTGSGVDDAITKFQPGDSFLLPATMPYTELRLASGELLCFGKVR